mmetsp:Transcript_5237/g.10616  ORF Transcript_5237/g.10616 Transcript_5237/m.10616 type:complete len:429 (+) Transcript_5237:1392-2678(+)
MFTVPVRSVALRSGHRQPPIRRMSRLRDELHAFPMVGPLVFKVSFEVKCTGILRSLVVMEHDGGGRVASRVPFFLASNDRRGRWLRWLSRCHEMSSPAQLMLENFESALELLLRSAMMFRRGSGRRVLRTGRRRPPRRRQRKFGPVQVQPEIKFAAGVPIRVLPAVVILVQSRGNGVRILVSLLLVLSKDLLEASAPPRSHGGVVGRLVVVVVVASDALHPGRHRALRGIVSRPVAVRVSTAVVVVVVLRTLSSASAARIVPGRRRPRLSLVLFLPSLLLRTVQLAHFSFVRRENTKRLLRIASFLLRNVRTQEARVEQKKSGGETQAVEGGHARTRFRRLVFGRRIVHVQNRSEEGGNVLKRIVRPCTPLAVARGDGRRRRKPGSGMDRQSKVVACGEIPVWIFHVFRLFPAIFGRSGGCSGFEERF